MQYKCLVGRTGKCPSVKRCLRTEVPAPWGFWKCTGLGGRTVGWPAMAPELYSSCTPGPSQVAAAACFSLFQLVQPRPGHSADLTLRLSLQMRLDGCTARVPRRALSTLWAHLRKSDPSVGQDSLKSRWWHVIRIWSTLYRAQHKLSPREGGLSNTAIATSEKDHGSLPPFPIR